MSGDFSVKVRKRKIFFNMKENIKNVLLQRYKNPQKQTKAQRSEMEEQLHGQSQTYQSWTNHETKAFSKEEPRREPV